MKFQTHRWDGTISCPFTDEGVCVGYVQFTPYEEEEKEEEYRPMTIDQF